MTQEIRDLLERTGRLFTQQPDDPGHISDFWRKKIETLCDLLDSTPLDVGAALRIEKAAHVRTHAALANLECDLDALEQRLASEKDAHAATLEKMQGARRLVEEAVPRMETLNNAMSPEWCQRASKFLQGS